MTKFETMDNMNADFVALSDRELMDMEGGEVFIITGVMVLKGLAALGAGVTIGKLLKGK